MKLENGMLSENIVDTMVLDLCEEVLTIIAGVQWQIALAIYQLTYKTPEPFLYLINRRCE